MKWLRKLIGTEDLYNQINDLNKYITGLRGKMTAIEGQAIAANKGMARLIAKLDPGYGRDELDPQVRAESDKIGDAIIKKLIGEHIASNRNQPL